MVFWNLSPIVVWMNMMLVVSTSKWSLHFNTVTVSVSHIETSNWRMLCWIGRARSKLLTLVSVHAYLMKRESRYSVVRLLIWLLKSSRKKNSVDHLLIFGQVVYYYLHFSVDNFRFEVKMIKISIKRFKRQN